MTAEGVAVSRDSINQEIKMLRAELNQTNDPAKIALISGQIESLQQQRNNLITNTMAHQITHSRLADAAAAADKAGYTGKGSKED